MASCALQDGLLLGGPFLHYFLDAEGGRQTCVSIYEDSVCFVLHFHVVFSFPSEAVFHRTSSTPLVPDSVGLPK
jgi:hypothetical protein